MSTSYISAIQQQLDGDGLPVTGAKLRFFNQGTTTPRTVYSDAALTIPIAQPVLSDANGFFQRVYVSAAVFRYTVHNAADVLVEDQDNVDPGISAGSPALAIAQGGTGATTAAGARSNLGVPATSVTTALDARVTNLEQVDAAPDIEAPVTLAYTATINPDFSADAVRVVTLTGNVTVGLPTIALGVTARLILIQDATGGRSGAWDGVYKFHGGSPPALSRAANAVDMFELYCRSTSPQIIEVASVKTQETIAGGTYDVLLEDQKASGTAGGASTTGSDIIRTLNTEVYDPRNLCTLGSNQFTLIGPATYQIEWSAPSYRSALHQSMLYDVTGTTILKRGEQGYSINASDSAESRSTGSHTVVVVGASNVFEIRHRLQTAQASNGLGQAASFGTETYTWVKIKRVA